jgi:DNA invertase Pin-like site-specific DNA recombinase
MNIGYARVSTGEQTLDLQLDALTAAECGKLFTEIGGGSLVERASLERVMHLS